MDIKGLNESARKVHGSDITITVARAVTWGNHDNLVLVTGERHLAAAADIARGVARTGMKAAITQEQGTGLMNRQPYFYSAVWFAAAGSAVR